MMQSHVTRFFFTFTLGLCVMFAAHTVSAETVKRIDIAGAQRVEQSTIASYMSLKKGDVVDSVATDRVLKDLYATGLFADVSVQGQGGVVSVTVVENPIVNEIVFEGNDGISDDELLSESQIRPRQVYTRTKVQESVNRLYQIYRRQGRFSASIEPKVIRLDQNRVNLVFEIDEGDVTKVASVRFIGNKKFSDRKLRSVISTKEKSWFRLLSGSSRYDPDRLSFDQEILRDFYYENGYADFQVLSAVSELSTDKDKFFITITVDEGIRYKVSDINIASQIRNFDAEILRDDLTFGAGWRYNAEAVKRSVSEMTQTMGDLQYAFVDIRPDIVKNRRDATISVTFIVNETPRVFVERINVNGNIRTLDKVVRREIELVEGDPFNKSKLEKSERSIRNLDFFEFVDVNVSQGSAPDKTVVDINVQEKSTGELSIGAGFSSSDGPLADFRIRERNLLGRGQDLLFSTTIAGERTEFDIAYTEPYFLGRDISAGIDLFHITRDFQDESSYDQQRSGVSLRLGYPLSENWRQTLRYSAERNEVTDVSDTTSRFIRDQEGERDTSSISQRLIYDTRDSHLFTTDGMTFWLDTELAGLGGDAKYVSAKTGASYFHPVTDDIILNVLGELGAIEGYSDTDVQINERFFLGGNTLRGFERSGLGPRDGTTNDSLGGNYFYRGTVEASFPLGLPDELGIRGHAYTDFGSLSGVDDTGSEILEADNIRASAGLGFSWRSPFGPIRVDYAVPFAKEDFDEEEKFRFDFGTRF